MATIDRIQTLKSKHAALEAALDEENARPHPDETLLANLKRQKLKLKDEMADLRRQ